MLLAGIFLIYILGIFSIFFSENRKLQQNFALGTSGIALVCSTDLFLSFEKTVVNFSEFISTSYFTSIFSYSFGLDGLSTAFLFLSCLLIFLCVLFIWDEKILKNIQSIYCLLVFF